ncbi:MAG: Lrp/AsnC family transcriptional regulator [Gammaproteobacteria bacterium]|jgi:DNA-binding Lrp family transcriptional regulator|nr:Lrp/AsnC family transcriptional regulator [Gammaproteobacteria bacterium]MDH3985394.1 Lrp/AsnC family transcriptional regulator [Gammaproteobacteria bacterium]
MDSIDARLVNTLQAGLPVCARPFDAVAATLDVPVDEVLSRLQCLLDDKVLTRFGPMFNAEKIGGALSLCALQAPAGRYDEIAELVNAFPEVAHNYERDHLLNMWFVVATEQPEQAAVVIREIEQTSGCQVYDMPKQEEFFIGLQLTVQETS